MKAWAPVLMGCIAVATALMFTPWTDAPMPEAVPASAPGPAAATVVAGAAAPAAQGFAGVGTVFTPGAASPTLPDPLAPGEARAAEEAAALADDKAATRDDTVPADAPREL